MLYCVGQSGDEFNTAMDMASQFLLQANEWQRDANFQEKKFIVVD